jgi:hypothetical protein
MGSIKKIKTVKPSIIKDVYLQMSINDKINFRTFFYWIGRQRMSYINVLKMQCPVDYSSIEFKQAGALGIFYFLNQPFV